jgi:hypothetical protein
MTQATSPPAALVAGATGATGRLLVGELLERGWAVRAIVRAPERLPAELRAHPRLAVVHGALLELPEAELARHAAGCAAVASCLGHNLTLRGIFGPPRRLVTEATRRLCRAIEAHRPPRPVRFVLMNTAGNRDRELPEPASVVERAVLAALRLLVPPQADNEDAAAHLRRAIGPDHPAVAWTIVRPDTLIDAPAATPYQVHPSPIRSPLFDAGRTSRHNVARFMAEFMTGDEAWARWRGRMPVLYDAAAGAGGAGGGAAPGSEEARHAYGRQEGMT